MLAILTIEPYVSTPVEGETYECSNVEVMALATSPMVGQLDIIACRLILAWNRTHIHMLICLRHPKVVSWMIGYKLGEGKMSDWSLGTGLSKAMLKDKHYRSKQGQGREPVARYKSAYGGFRRLIRTASPIA